MKFIVWFVLCISLTLTGCQKGTTLVGTVKLDGEKLSEGSIVFQGNSLPSCYAEVDSSGSYQALNGNSNQITPGSYKAVVSVFEEIPSKDPNGLPGRKLLTPKKYSDPGRTDLLVEVKENTRNVFDIEMTTPPGS